MNKQKGNMYGFVTHTINYIKGKCPHSCNYCYMIPIWKRFNSTKQVFDEKELKTNLGSGNFIFVGSSTDMFAEQVPDEWINRVLDTCKKFDNTYLFQTKNPNRFLDFEGEFPKDVILGTTLETNRMIPDISKAPLPVDRVNGMIKFNEETMVSIEPILDFDLNLFVGFIQLIEPKFVSIGADSKGCGLKEPDGNKIRQLIDSLKQFTEVRVKKNLNRLLKEDN